MPLIDAHNHLHAFSGYFLHARKSKVLDAYRDLPPDRLLLETDAPEMHPPEACISHPRHDEKNHPANLIAIAHALAAQLDEPPTSLMARCQRNARQFFRLADDA